MFETKILIRADFIGQLNENSAECKKRTYSEINNYKIVNFCSVFKTSPSR